MGGPRAGRRAESKVFVAEHESPIAAMVSLTSGERVRIEGWDETEIDMLLSAFGDSLVHWLRIGRADVIDHELTREARHPAPALLVLVVHHHASQQVKEARRKYGSLPILAVGQGTELDALEAGADAFCEFHVERQIFQGRLRALLRRHSGCFQPVNSQAIALEQAHRILRVGGTPIQLSPRECTLIARLHEEQECWVSSESLWQAVARTRATYDSSLLRTFVLNVRKKLGAQRWMLQTERNRGVMLTTSAIYQTLTRA